MEREEGSCTVRTFSIQFFRLSPSCLVFNSLLLFFFSFFAKIINKIKQIIKKKVFIGGCYRKYLIIIIINSLRTGTKFIQLMF